MSSPIDSVLRCDNVSVAMETTIQARIDERTRKQLLALAKQERRTLSNFIRLVLERTIEESKKLQAEKNSA